MTLTRATSFRLIDDDDHDEAEDAFSSWNAVVPVFAASACSCDRAKALFAIY